MEVYSETPLLRHSAPRISKTFYLRGTLFPLPLPCVERRSYWLLEGKKGGTFASVERGDSMECTSITANINPVFLRNNCDLFLTKQNLKSHFISKSARKYKLNEMFTSDEGSF